MGQIPRSVYVRAARADALSQGEYRPEWFASTEAREAAIASDACRMADTPTLRAIVETAHAAGEVSGYTLAITRLRQLATLSGPLFTPKQLADILENAKDRP